MPTVCNEDGFLVDTETGEVLDRCFEVTEVEQDKELKHYSITKPIPYVPEKIKNRMKEKNLWLKGEEWMGLLFKFVKKIEYLKELERELCGS